MDGWSYTEIVTNAISWTAAIASVYFAYRSYKASKATEAAANEILMRERLDRHWREWQKSKASSVDKREGV
jgi:hypothetical protein